MAGHFNVPHTIPTLFLFLSKVFLGLWKRKRLKTKPYILSIDIVWQNISLDTSPILGDKIRAFEHFVTKTRFIQGREKRIDIKKPDVANPHNYSVCFLLFSLTLSFLSQSDPPEALHWTWTLLWCLGELHSLGLSQESGKIRYSLLSHIS